MSDIRKFAVLPSKRLHLRGADSELMFAEGPDGAPDETKPMAVVVYGPGSKQYIKAQTAENNRLTERLKQKGSSDQTPEEVIAEQVSFLSDCTQSFENVDYDGLTGRELSDAVYSDIKIGFIGEQVRKFLGSWANFMKPSTKTSASTSGKAPG